MIQDFGEHLAQRPGVAAVLFYGNILRETDAGGLIDYYVLTTLDSDYHGYGASAAANRLLPPNVYHEAFEGKHAKVAVMSVSAFVHRMRKGSWDTTLWTRFSQPTRLLFAERSTREALYDAIAQGWRTAAYWADALVATSPEAQTSRWTILFRHTYGVELRPEGGSARASRIVETSPELFARIDTELPPVNPSPAEAKSTLRRWKWRKAVGKPLNLLRLLKAAFTFRGGSDYIISKLERHTNGEVALKPWERRHPWLAAPIILFRVLRRRNRS